MADLKPWQVYGQNGDPIPGVGAGPDDFESGSNIVKSAAHIWMWRDNNGVIEVAVQRRAPSKSSWAGYLDITAAGHVDLGEMPLQAAVRETKEEIDYQLDPAKLIWLFACRAATVQNNEIDYVYAYEVDATATFSFNDGEVESVTWYPLDKFIEMAHDPDTYKLVPQGVYYFGQLVDYLKKQI